MSSERQENNPDNPWWGEHTHRYQEVLKYVHNQAKILDIACGSGFGSYLLALKGFKVIGADLSQEAIDLCKENFSHPDLLFQKADATALPFPDKYFDAIVSFETIEHTPQYLEVLKEFKRVLKVEGVILLSTPNIKVNSPDGVVRNPFHTQEWNYEELMEILNSVYPQLTLLGQHYSRYHFHKGLKANIAKLAESFFYLRGIRKLPLSFKDAILRSLINLPMYPSVGDYELVSEINTIRICKTFFAVCRLKSV